MADGKRKKFIKRLEVSPGVVVERENQIVNGIYDFYSKLYSKEEMTRPGIEGLEWGPIDQTVAAWLGRPFDEKEIREAVFYCERDKAPSLDVNKNFIGGDCVDGVRAFVKGRQILDVVLVANEVVDEYRSLGKEGILFKVDFDKAYGHVDWGNRVSAIHLQYADDTIFFSTRDESEIVNLYSILRLFGVISGLKVNLEKSRVVSINMQQDLLWNRTAFLGCGIEALLFKYLGLPLGGNPRSEAFWNPVVEKIGKRLKG
ncbi:uncharacterized protein LOC114288989 [Camellia sinensis]|uniref:uncharacterized protein LOC114288989 n=1 Tax=Camellia sinensis TaxID=4442 RepID=UPI0010369A43|nr:uncharacterized protein LOC114288989 [Camellia sinensis]